MGSWYPEAEIKLLSLSYSDDKDGKQVAVVNGLLTNLLKYILELYWSYAIFLYISYL